MKKVKEFSSVEAAKAALHIYGIGGMQPVVQQLAYISMTKDDKPSDAFKSLSYLLTSLFREQDAPLDLAADEYASTVLKEDQDAEGWSTLRQRRLARRETYKLYKRIGTDPDPERTPWDHPDEFQFDQELFDQLMNKATQNTGNLDLAWKAFRVSTGLEAGAIRHRLKGADVSYEDLFIESDFIPTEDFLKFLDQEDFTFKQK